MLNTEYNHVFNELQNYMLDNKNITKSLELKIISTTNKVIDRKIDIKIDINKKCQDIFIPIEKDTLFWCYYIIINGEVNYEILNNKNILVEKQMKIELVPLVRKNKHILKTYKFDTITNIENNLANDNNMNIKTFLLLCTISNLNVIYINKKTYFESLMNDTSVIYVVNEVFNKYYKKYGFQLATDEKITDIRKTLYKLDKIDKPIKTISSYKVKELIDICKKLTIETTYKDTGKNKSKKDLYELIVQYFQI